MGVAKKYVAALIVLMSSGLIAGNPPGSWLAHVPDKERMRRNPFESDPHQAIQAGGKIFQQRCASCHGANAEGKGKRPSLHSERVQNATPGELQWLLKNGSLIAGMPSWSRLPEEQRWQIVSYVKSLQSQPSSSQK